MIDGDARDWIGAAEARALLGVRAQTLYAYVSRGLVRARTDPADARRSLYLRRDVEEAARRHRRPRARASVAAGAIAWGEPVLETSVSHVRDGQLLFGKRLATDCAETMTLEEVAAHHWRVPRFGLVPPPASTPDLSSPGSSSPGASPLEGGLLHLVARAARAPPMAGRARADLAGEGAALLSGTVDAMLGRSGAGTIHERIAAAFGVAGPAADLVRRALVLLSDHELNPSTFAARICASTGSSLPAALLAGLATLTGPRHGGSIVAVRAAIDAAKRGERAMERFLAARTGSEPYAFGFGHPLYADGDPRAASLLERIDPAAPALVAVRRLSARIGSEPNIDVALAVVRDAHRLPDHGPLFLFAAGRLAGWIAHAIEQNEAATIIRPRGRYVVAPSEA